jgi:hypothetical protein
MCIPLIEVLPTQGSLKRKRRKSRDHKLLERWIMMPSFWHQLNLLLMVHNLTRSKFYLKTAEELILLMIMMVNMMDMTQKKVKVTKNLNLQNLKRKKNQKV